MSFRPEIPYRPDDLAYKIHLINDILFNIFDPWAGPFRALDYPVAERESLPQFFCDKWNVRMQKLQNIFEYSKQDSLGRLSPGLALFPSERRLGKFQILVAEFAPDKIIHEPG